MIYKEVTFQKVYNLGNYSSERIEIVGVLEPGETVNNALNQARHEAESNHITNNPQLYQDKTPDIPVIPKSNFDVAKHFNKETDELAYGNTLREQVQSCKSLAVLKIYEKRYKTPEEQLAYEIMYKELSK